MMKIVRLFALFFLVQTAYGSLEAKDLPKHLVEASKHWRAKCILMYGDKSADVEEAKKGNFNDGLKDYVGCLYILSEVLDEDFKIVKDKMRSYLPPPIAASATEGYAKCADSVRDNGKSFGDRSLEMAKCNYNRDPPNFIIF